MLRLAYLASLYLWYEWRLLGRYKRKSKSDEDDPPPWAGGGGGEQHATCYRGGSGWQELKRELKRSVISEKLTPLTVLTSVVSDLDLFADWYFLSEVLDGEDQRFADAAFFFTVVGTVMYILLTLEFHPVSEAWTCCRGGRALSPLQHVPLGWQLLINVMVEDIPQLVITCLTSPTSVAGVLNIATAGFALLAKMAEAVASRKDLPMSSQLCMIETDPGVVQSLVMARQKAEELAANAASLAVLVNKFRVESAAVARDSGARGPKRLTEIAFQVAQVDPTFLNGELGYVREKLEVPTLDVGRCGLRGSIPPFLGSLAQLTELNLGANSLGGLIPKELGNLSGLSALHLNHNRLVGHIPAELGLLRELRTLHLQENQLTGVIPAALGKLTKLERLCLDHNKLDGVVPQELEALRSLRVLYLGGNHLTGEIPRQLGAITALRQLNLAGSQLRGSEAESRLVRLFPACEVSVSSWTNDWG
ncbi:unnamed protein product [Scytosiphon promiscuus]